MHKITEKLAPINKKVFILNSDETIIRTGTLNIYTEKSSLQDSGELKEGDIYWTCHSESMRRCWYPIEIYPYWLTNEELIKLIIDREEANRFEILDIRNEI